MTTNELASDFIEINGFKTAYRKAGQGEPTIVFVHGWALSLDEWSAAIDYFSNNHRILAYDWRGMGQSTGGDTPCS